MKNKPKRTPIDTDNMAWNSISLRDYFAAKAMSGMVLVHCDMNKTARIAYEYADAMLAERGRKAEEESAPKANAALRKLILTGEGDDVDDMALAINPDIYDYEGQPNPDDIAINEPQIGLTIAPITDDDTLDELTTREGLVMQIQAMLDEHMDEVKSAQKARRAKLLGLDVEPVDSGIDPDDPKTWIYPCWIECVESGYPTVTRRQKYVALGVDRFGDIELASDDDGECITPDECKFRYLGPA